VTAANSPLHRRKALVVEDEVIISFLVEDLLSEFSCDVSLAANVPSALKLLDEGKPDFAVLDVNVGDEMVFPVAERLKKAGVPFIFTTGYGRGGLPREWADRPVLQKPYDASTLSEALAALLNTP
jgi:DNA-binding response OmpR family regulator